MFEGVDFLNITPFVLALFKLIRFNKFSTNGFNFGPDIAYFLSKDCLMLQLHQKDTPFPGCRREPHWFHSCRHYVKGGDSHFLYQFHFCRSVIEVSRSYSWSLVSLVFAVFQLSRTSLDGLFSFALRHLRKFVS